MGVSVLVVSSSKDLEQKDKKVYEIKVKNEGADDGTLPFLFGPGKSGISHFLYLLGIICSQTDKDDDARISDEPIDGRVSKEEIHQ